MRKYEVNLRFDSIDADSAESAAKQVVRAYLSNPNYQPASLDVVDLVTGEVENVSVIELRSNELNYSQSSIARRLREQPSVMVDDVFTIDAGVVLLGRMLTGVLRVGDSGHFMVDDIARSSKVAGITIGRDLFDQAYFPEEVGLLFKDDFVATFPPGNVLVLFSA